MWIMSNKKTFYEQAMTGYIVTVFRVYIFASVSKAALRGNK